MVEEAQVYALPHRAIGSEIRVEVVAGVEFRSQGARVLRVPHQGIEIDDAIERAATANPRVDRLTRSFFFFREEECIPKGQQRPADDRDAPFVRLLDDLQVSGNELIESNRGIGHPFDGPAADADVVDAFEYDEIGEAG